MEERICFQGSNNGDVIDSTPMHIIGNEHGTQRERINQVINKFQVHYYRNALHC